MKSIYFGRIFVTGEKCGGNQFICRIYSSWHYDSGLLTLIRGHH